MLLALVLSNSSSRTQAKRNAVTEMLRKPASELDRADARCYATLRAEACSYRHGCTNVFTAMGSTAKEYFATLMGANPMISRKKMPSDAVPRRMAALLLELLRAGELPKPVLPAVWEALNVDCCLGRPSVIPLLVEGGVVDLIVGDIKAVGSVAVRVCSFFNSCCCCVAHIGIVDQRRGR